MKRENREKLNLRSSNRSREGMQARQTSELVKQIKSQAALNLSRDAAAAQRTQQPNIYLIQSNPSQDRFATSAESSFNRFDYRKQRGSSNQKPKQIKKSLKDDSFQYMQRDSLNVEQTAPLHNQSLDQRLDNDSRIYVTREQMNQSVDAALNHQGRGASCKVQATPQSYKKTTNTQHNAQQRVGGFQRIKEDDQTSAQLSASQNLTIDPRTPAKNPTQKRPQTVGRAKKAVSITLKHTAASRQRAIDADALRRSRLGLAMTGDAATPKTPNILNGDLQTPQSHQTQQKIKSNQKDKSGAKKKPHQGAFYLNLQFLNKSAGEFQHTASSGAQSQLMGSSLLKQGKTKQSSQIKDSHGHRIHCKEDRDGAIKIEDEQQDDASYESRSRMWSQSYGRIPNQPCQNKKVNEDSHKYLKDTDKRAVSHQSAPGLKHLPIKAKEKHQIQNLNRTSGSEYFQNQEMQSRLSEEANSESKNVQSPRCRSSLYQSVEEKNENDVQQKIKMKELGNQYMKKSSRSCKKRSQQPAAQCTMNTKEEEQMILERMREAQAEYMQQKILNAEKTPGPKTKSCDRKVQKQSRQYRNSIDTQNSRATRQSSQNVQPKTQSRAQAKADMQKKLKFLYQKLGAVMRGYKARRIYHNNKQIKQFRLEFRDLIQFAYSLKIEIQNLQDRLDPADPQIEKTKQLLLTSLKDLIQKRQQFAAQMDRLYNPHSNFAGRTRSRSPEKVGSRVEWIAESQPRFIQSAQFKQEVQKAAAASLSASNPASGSKQLRSKRDLRSKSQYRQQFINAAKGKEARQLQDDSSVENREELHQSFYREEASREGRHTGSKQKLTRYSPQKSQESPLKFSRQCKEQKTLNSDLMNIDYSCQATSAPGASSGEKKSQQLTFGANTRTQSRTGSRPETQIKSTTGYQGEYRRGSIAPPAPQREAARHAVTSLEERSNEVPNRRAKPTKLCQVAPSKPLAARRSTTACNQADKNSKHLEQLDQKHGEQQQADERKRPQSQLGVHSRQGSLAERRDFLKKSKNAGYSYSHQKSIQQEKVARSTKQLQENHIQSVDVVSIDIGFKADKGQQKTAQTGAASPQRTLPLCEKGEYESPYKFHPSQASGTGAGTRNFMKANIQRIKRLEEQRKVSSSSCDLTASRNHCRSKTISLTAPKVVQTSVSVERAEPKTEEKVKQPFVSKIPRLSPSKSPVKTQRPEEAESKNAAKRSYIVGSKVAEYIYQSAPQPHPAPGQRAPDGKLHQTNEWIRQSNQNYIKKVLNDKSDKKGSTSSQRHYRTSSFASHSVQSSSFARQEQAAEQETVHQGAPSKAHFASVTAGQYRGGAKSSAINNRYEHQRTYSNISSMSKLHNETSVNINLEAQPEIQESRSPSPQRSRQPSPERADVLEQRVSPARSQFSDNASPSRVLQSIIERFSPLKNATFENQYIQKRKPSRGKPESVIRQQQRVQEAPAGAAAHLTASDAILRREPSPLAGTTKTPPEIHTASEVSVSQIAESPAPARQAELNPESPHQYAQSYPISPYGAASNVQPEVGQGLVTLDAQRISGDIDMFDQNRRCLDLRRSSNFNSFATSEAMNTRTCKEGSAAKRESPKHSNPYLDLRWQAKEDGSKHADLQHSKIYPTNHKLDDCASGKTEKDGDSTFRLCPQTVQNYSSQGHSRVASNVTSTKNQYASKHFASPSHNPCSESSPIKTRSMAMREFIRNPEPVEESPSKFKHSPAYSPSSAKKSHMSRKTRKSPNKENAYLDAAAPFSIELVAASKSFGPEPTESHRFQTRRRSRGERQNQSSVRQSTRRTGQSAIKRTALPYQHTTYQHTFKAPALQEQPSNCSLIDIKTPTSYMAMEYVGLPTKEDFPVPAKEPFSRTRTCTPSKPAMKSAAAAGLSTPLKQYDPMTTPSRNRSAQALPAPATASSKQGGTRGPHPSYQRLSNQKRSQQSCLALKPVLKEQKERHSSKGMTTPKGSNFQSSRYLVQSTSRDAQSNDNMSHTLSKIQHAVDQLQQQQYEQAQTSDNSNMQAVIQSLQEQVFQMNQLMERK